MTQAYSIDLSSNKMRCVQGLANLTRLSKLDLSYNQIESARGLEQMFDLRRLSMASNRVCSMQGLESLLSLTHLDMSANQIEYVPGMDKLTQLTSIFLTDNRIKSISSIAFSSLSEFYCANNRVESLDAFLFADLASFKVISLRNNRIQSIGSEAFRGISPENTIDLSANSNVTRISHFSLSSSSYLYFSYESLLLLKHRNYSHFHCDTLDLSRNKIAAMHANSVKGLFKRLLLRGNSIALFEPNSFGYMPNLVEIDFSKNLIKELNFADAFEFSQPNVTRLDFNSNKIKSIHVLNSIF